MKLRTAVSKYLETDKEIYIADTQDGRASLLVDKAVDFDFQFEPQVGDVKVRKIDLESDPTAVTIYI